MGRIITNTYICDACRETINPGRVVEVLDHGLAFHPKCFTETSGPQLLQLMGNDRTTVADYDEQGRPIGQVLRVRETETIRPDGTVTGSSETVNW